MSGYPVILNLSDRLAVVVGGGTVGQRKVAGLLSAGARVRLISLDPVSMSNWDKPVELVQRAFHPDDLNGAFLAFAATGIADVDNAVLDAARRRCIPVNLATRPQGGDFNLPAIMHRGDLTVTVSTEGRAPALATAIRDRLEIFLGPEWGLVTEICARLRREKLTVSHDTAYSQKVLVELLDAGLADLLAHREAIAIDLLLTRVCGRETTLAGLGLTLPDRMP